MSTDDGWAMRTQDAQVGTGERAREMPQRRRSGMVTSIARLPQTLARATPGPLLVRGAVFAAGVLALLVAWPAEIVASQALPILIIVALPAALAPRTGLTTVVLLGSAGGWLVSTMVFGEPVTYPRLILLAAAMYLLHTLAALAALLPYDAVLAPAVFVGWLMRAGVAIGITAVLGAMAVILPGYLGDRRYLAASLVGLLIMIALAGYLVALVRRRD